MNANFFATLRNSAVRLNFKSNLLSSPMQSSTQNWQQNEFMAFLLLYAAKADSKIVAAESNFIIQHFGSDAYATAKVLFDKQSDYEILQTIADEKERLFPGVAGKQTIHEHLTALFKADGDFSSIEKVVLSALERII